MTNKIQFEDFTPNMDEEQYTSMYEQFQQQESAECKAEIEQLAAKLDWEFEVDRCTVCLDDDMNVVISVNCADKFPPNLDGSGGRENRQYYVMIDWFGMESETEYKATPEEALEDALEELGAIQESFRGLASKIKTQRKKMLSFITKDNDRDFK